MSELNPRHETLRIQQELIVKYDAGSRLTKVNLIRGSNYRLMVGVMSIDVLIETSPEDSPNPQKMFAYELYHPSTGCIWCYDDVSLWREVCSLLTANPLMVMARDEIDRPIF